MNETEIVKKQEKLIQHYKDLFSSPVGIIVLNDLMTRFSLYRTTFSKETNEIIFREGERNVIFFIMHMLDIDPEKYLRMYRERNLDV